MRQSMEALSHDVRVALRGFKRAPAFVSTVILTIGLAIGLNTSAFSVFDAYVLRPLTLRDPATLFELTIRDRRGWIQRLTHRQFDALNAIPAISDAFAYEPLTIRSDRGVLSGVAVTDGAFRVLGGVPVRGRPLEPADALPGSDRGVVVLSSAAWKAKFGGDTSIIGQTISLRGLPLTVIGVMAPSFSGISAGPPDFWIPATLASRIEGLPDSSSAERSTFTAVVRLRRGAAPTAARAAIETWARNITSSAADSMRWQSVTLESRATAVSLSATTLLTIAPVAAAFSLVLLIACVNVANVMLARGATRQREFGVRLALGATRTRLIAQLLTECALLALPAAAVGAGISRVTLIAAQRALIAILPPSLAFGTFTLAVPRVDFRIFVFVLASALAVLLLIGLLPALQSTKTDLVRSGRGTTDTTARGHGLRRLRGALIASQVGACCVLLIVGGILLRGASKAQRFDAGMRTRDVVELTLDEHERASSLTRIRGFPDVVSAGASSQSPLAGAYPLIAVSASAGQRDDRSQAAGVALADSAFFATLDIPIVRGRDFTSSEVRGKEDVAVVSETAARRLWPGLDPVGRTLRPEPSGDSLGSHVGRSRLVHVVGVARDAASGWLGFGSHRPVVYLPRSADANGMKILVRVRGDPAIAARRLEAALTAASPAAIVDLHRLEDDVIASQVPFRLLSWVSALLGVIALCLTVVGIFGVISYLVAQRTKEIGIRVALGASLGAVVSLVLRQTGIRATTGIVCGASVTLLASNIAASLFVVIDTLDPLSYGVGIATVIATCAIAAWVPTVRAVRISPMVAMREE